MNVPKIFFRSLIAQILLCSAALCLTSCSTHLVPLISVAHFSPPLKPSFAVATNTAAVYGRFKTGPEFAFGNELALRLRNIDSKHIYLIRCREKDSVYAIAVAPGHYELAGFIGTFIDHRPTGQGGYPQFGPFQVSSNAATYIGDFNTFASIGPMVQSRGIRGFTNSFAATTEELRPRCTNLASARVLSAFDQVSTNQTPAN